MGLRKLVPLSVRVKIEMEVYKSLSRSSRIVEIPFVLGSIEPMKPCKLLVLGSWNDFVAYQLASLGFQIFGFDLRNDKFNHPNYKLTQGDFLKTSNNFADSSFDKAYSISTIEHIGLGAYGEANMVDGDRRAVSEISRLLKNGGSFVFTVPFGHSGTYPKDKPFYRKYGMNELTKLIEDFHILRIRYFGCISETWIPVSPEKIEHEESDVPKVVACVFVQKRLA